MKYFFIFIGIISFNTVIAQDYPLAPEIWSEPVRLDSVSTRRSWDESPALNKNLDTMYFGGADGIYMSVKINDVWQRRVKLDENVNDGTPIRYPSISKDGKRLYTTAYAGYGSWDIWYNDWDPDSVKWGKPKNMGPVINSPYIDYYLYEVSKDTVYVVTSKWSGIAPAMYVWNEQSASWVIADSFYYHPFGAGNFLGLSITGNKSKLYFSRRSALWTDSKARGYELCVSYWDTTINNWGNPYFLNINKKGFQPDTSKDSWIGTYEAFPWISHDGKALFFCSNRDAAIEDSVSMSDIYISHLLVDENGDTVSYIDDKNDLVAIKFALHQNYPNPFNTTTVIEYTIGGNILKYTNISIELYNILGKKIATILEAKQRPGKHTTTLNAGNYKLASGIYFLSLNVGYNTKTRKILYIK